MDAAKHVLTRHRRTIVFVLITIIVFSFLYALRSVIFPFALGLAVAYLLWPIVMRAESQLPPRIRRYNIGRVLVILIVYITILVIIGLIGFYTFAAVAPSFANLIGNAPQYIASAIDVIRHWAQSIRQQLPPELQQQLDQWLSDAGTAVGNAVRSIFFRSITLIPSTLSFILGFLTLPIFIFFLLKDWDLLGRVFYSAFPPSASEDARNTMAIIGGVLGR